MAVTRSVAGALRELPRRAPARRDDAADSSRTRRATATRCAHDGDAAHDPRPRRAARAVLRQRAARRAPHGGLPPGRRARRDAPRLDGSRRARRSGRAAGARRRPGPTAGGARPPRRRATRSARACPGRGSSRTARSRSVAGSRPAASTARVQLGERGAEPGAADRDPPVGVLGDVGEQLRAGRAADQHRRTAALRRLRPRPARREVHVLAVEARRRRRPTAPAWRARARGRRPGGRVIVDAVVSSSSSFQPKPDPEHEPTAATAGRAWRWPWP